MNDIRPVTFHPIGVVATDHHEAGTTPIQGRLNPAAVGRVILDPAFAAGLDGLDGFDFAWLLTHLDRPDVGRGDPLRPVPFLAPDAEAVGVFATRYPRRPNAIGLSLIEITSVDGPVVSFRGVDLLDQTPVLDLKPWVPRFDLPGDYDPASRGPIRTGWYERSKLHEPISDDPSAATPDGLEGHR